MKICNILSILLVLNTSTSYAQSGALDLTFDPGSGADGPVLAIAIQSDGKVLLGGDFNNYNGVSRFGIARLNVDGSLDATFNPGTGFDNEVRSLAVASDGKIYVAGWFTTFNSAVANRVVRLNADGSVDSGFDVGGGPDAAVLAMVLDANDRPVIGGVFANVSGTSRSRIARLNTDGSLDMGFNPGSGANAQVSAISLQTDGNLVIGGTFQTYNGATRNRIARILSDGLLDGTFTSNPGANNEVTTIALQSDGKLIIGGAFTFFGGSARNRVARLNTNGSLDSGFNPGTGANAVVHDVASTTDGKVLLAGSFVTVNGASNIRIARLNADGSVDAGFDAGTSADVNINTIALQADGRILIGGQFSQYDGTGRNRVARLYGCSLPQPGIITGQGDAICIASELLYSIDAVPDASSYMWTLPVGWMGSSSSTSITPIAGPESGNITVAALSDACGESEAQTLAVNVVELAPEVPICLVTVDSTSQHNIVAWEKPLTARIDSFYVYREITTNNFQKIGAVHYDSLSLYRDFDVDPNSTFYRYSLSVLDTCGYESELSLYHSTMFLQVQTNGNLNWTLYDIENQPNPVNFFRVYRDDLGNNNFVAISTTIPGGNGVFTDPNWASFPNARYVVDVNWDISCLASRDNVNINTTRSNVERGIFDPVGVGSGAAGEFKMYPNPASSSVILVLPENFGMHQAVLFNALGQDVLRTSVQSGKNELQLNGLTKGVYAVRVGNEVRRLVLE